MDDYSVGDIFDLTLTVKVVEVDHDDQQIPLKVEVLSGLSEVYGAHYWLGDTDISVRPTEPDLGDPAMELLGLSTSVQDKHNRSMALHHAVELGKATLAAGDSMDAETLVNVAKVFEAYLKGEK